MAKFFKETADLKKYIDVSNSYSVTGWQTKEDYSINQYLVKWIGTAQLNEISTAYAADPDTPMSTVHANLLAKIQMPLAHFALYEHIPFIETIIDDAGLHRTENEHTKTAYSGQVENLSAATLQTAYNSLETLLAFLEDNEADYPLWVSSDGYTRNKANFINSAADFNDAYPISMSRLAFYALGSFMRDVEYFEIRREIGTAFFDELKAAIAAKTTTEAQKYVIGLIQKAVANFTMEMACAHGWTSFTPQGVVSFEYDNDETGKKATPAVDKALSLKLRELHEAGNRWRATLLSYLRSNMDTFPTFKNDTSVNPTTDDDSAVKKHRRTFRI